jgi:hypothetical protein
MTPGKQRFWHSLKRRAMSYSAAVILLLPFQNLEAQSSFELTGQVSNSSGQAVAEAHVYFDGVQGYFALTAVDGGYRVPNFQPGNYSIRVQRGPNVQSFLREVRQDDRLDLVVDW